MKNFSKHFLSLVFLITILILPYFVFAGNKIPTTKEVLKDLGTNSGYTTDNPDKAIPDLVGIAINTFLSLLGVIFIVLMLIGGYYYMIAGGDQAKVDKGLAYIRHGIIGLIIVVGSFAIWQFIFSKFILGGATGTAP